jgi:hypothetical protein
MSAGTSGMVSLLGLDPATYRSHSLHGSDRVYAETNCYTDILVEFVHARGGEPLAMMPCALSVDFEGDQWTFFKPRPEDVERLYGIDIHEMQPYRPLPVQIAEQVAMGRTLIVELDSFYLPDTASTSYRNDHVKSSVVAESIDPEGERFRYFHGTGYHELEDVDYREIFRLGREFSADVLPPYTELARLDAGPLLEGEELNAAARAVLAADLPRLCLRDRADGRLRLRGRCLERPLVPWRGGRGGRGRDGRDRRGQQDPQLQAGAATGVRSAALRRDPRWSLGAGLRPAGRCPRLSRLRRHAHG